MKFPKTRRGTQFRPVCPDCKKTLKITGIYRFEPPAKKKNIIGLSIRNHHCPLCHRNCAEIGIVTPFRSLDGLNIDEIM